MQTRTILTRPQAKTPLSYRLPMIQPAFRFCPKCGHELVTKDYEGDQKQVCSSCGFVFYYNQSVTTSAVIYTEGKLLLTRRKRNPHQGMLDLAGGFVDPQESPQQGMVREIQEEMHVNGRIIKCLGAFGPDPYLFQDMTIYNCAIHYQVDIGNQVPTAGDDAESLEWVDLATLQVEDVAFPSQQECLRLIQQGKIHLDSTQ